MTGVSGRACQAPGCGRELPAGRRRFCSDLCRVRGQRAERRYDSGEVGQAAIRLIRAAARRAGASDVAEFGVLWDVRAEVDRACTEAIGQLRTEGFSWTEIAAEADQSRQGVTQWYQRHAGRSKGNDLLRGEGR